MSNIEEKIEKQKQLIERNWPNNGSNIKDGDLEQIELMHAEQNYLDVLEILALENDPDTTEIEIDTEKD
jgi:hypothetical protein